MTVSADSTHVYDSTQCIKIHFARLLVNEHCLLCFEKWQNRCLLEWVESIYTTKIPIWEVIKSWNPKIFLRQVLIDLEDTPKNRFFHTYFSPWKNNKKKKFNKKSDQFTKLNLSSSLDRANLNAYNPWEIVSRLQTIDPSPIWMWKYK